MESILNNTERIHVIPSYASIDEHALYTIASVEETYTNICEEIGIFELSTVMEANGKVGDKVKAVYDKSKLKVVIDKIIGAVKDLWNKFKDLCATVRERVVKFVKEKKAKFKEANLDPKDLAEAIKKSPEDKWSGNYVDTNFTKAEELVKALSRATEDVCNAINAAKANTEKASEINVDEIYKNKCLSKIEGLAEADYGNAGKIKEAVKDNIIFTGNITREYAANNVTKYLSNNAISEFTNHIKPSYNKTKDALDKIIADLKKSKTDVGFKDYIKAATVSTKLNSAIVGAIEVAFIKRLISEYAMVFKAATYAAAYKLKAKNEAATAPEIPDTTTQETPAPAPEAPVTESSSFQTELASLFNF